MNSTTIRISTRNYERIQALLNRAANVNVPVKMTQFVNMLLDKQLDDMETLLDAHPKMPTYLAAALRTAKETV